MDESEIYQLGTGASVYFYSNINIRWCNDYNLKQKFVSLQRSHLTCLSVAVTKCQMHTKNT